MSKPSQVGKTRYNELEREKPGRVLI
jgi:hypothetical protein